MKTTYYASDDSLGSTNGYHCDLYRSWAEKALKAKYPTHTITVSKQECCFHTETDDHENADEIELYASGLCDECQWDWERE